MPEKSAEQMIMEVHQGVFGVSGTEDMGLIGTNKADHLLILKLIKQQNGRIGKLEITLACLITALISTGVLEYTGVISIFG